MFKVNDRINHKVFGKGTVTESTMEGATNYITVKFDTPQHRDVDSYIKGESEPVDTRRFTEASIKPFLI